MYFNSLIFSKFTNQCLRNWKLKGTKSFEVTYAACRLSGRATCGVWHPGWGPPAVWSRDTGASRGSASKQSARWQVFMSHQWHATRQQIPQGHGTKLRKGTALKTEHCRLRSSSSTVHISSHLSISFGSGLQPSVQGRLLLTNASNAVVSKAGVILEASLLHNLLSVYKQSTTLSGLISSSVSGIVGNRADRVKPQNFWGDMSFLMAVNFHPIWLAQILHWATVQANPGNQLCSVEGRPIRVKLEALYTVSVSCTYPWGFT